MESAPVDIKNLLQGLIQISVTAFKWSFLKLRGIIFLPLKVNVRIAPLSRPATRHEYLLTII